MSCQSPDRFVVICVDGIPVGAANPLPIGGAGPGSNVLVTDIEDGAGDSVMDPVNDAIRVNVVAGGAGGGAVTIADGADVALGATADTAATTDAGTFSLIALFKRLLGKFTTQFPAALVGGRFDVNVGAALPAGTNNIGDVDVLTLPNVTLGASTNTIEVVGDAAHDAPIAGNPNRIAGRGLSADYVAVATGDTVDLIASLLGKLVILRGALPANTWNFASAAGGLVTTGGVTAKAAAAAGVRNYVTKVSIVNSHPTIGTEVVIRDGAAGTVLWRGWAQAAGGGQAEVLDPPLRGSTATLIEVAEITATATTGVLVNLQGYVAEE